MKDQLEQLYGEYLQLKEQSSDYLLRNKYQEKMYAIDKILEAMPYGAKNPATEVK